MHVYSLRWLYKIHQQQGQISQVGHCSPKAIIIAHPHSYNMYVANVRIIPIAIEIIKNPLRLKCNLRACIANFKNFPRAYLQLPSDNMLHMLPVFGTVF